MADSNKEMFHA